MLRLLIRKYSIYIPRSIIKCLCKTYIYRVSIKYTTLMNIIYIY